MPEDFATNYVIQGPYQLLGINFVLMAVGAIVAAIFPNPNASMPRAPYVFACGLAYFLMSLSEVPWMWTPQLIAAGRAWLLIPISWLAWFGLGFAVWRLSAARSRDAFGHAGAAILAFVPLLWLWLAVMRSRGTSSAPAWMLRGVVGVLSGLVLLGLAQATIYQAGKTKVRDLILDQTLPRDVVAQFMVNTIGLEETLAFIVDDLHPPVRLDAVTTLVDAKAEGKTLHTSLRLSGIMKLFSIPQDDLKSGLCAVPLNVPLLRAGATLRFTYDDADGRELARLALTADECGLSSSASPWSKLSAMSFSLPKPPAEGAAGAPVQAKASDLAQGPVQETLATRLIVQDNWLIRLVGLGFAVLGGAVSALLFVSDARMARPTYVLGNGIILVLAVLAGAALIPVPGVVETGVIGTRVLIWAFVEFACGFALWRLAAARSRDALGHSMAGALAFIPLANLWLMLAPPREEPGTVVRTRLVGALRGGLYVLAGLGLAALAFMLAQEEDRRTRVAIVEDEALPISYQMRYLVNNDGLERTLEYLSHLTVTSETIDDRLVLQKVEAAGTVLTRTVRFSGPELASSAMQTRTARKNICSDEGYVALLEAGATIRESYRGRFNLELGSVAVRAGDCRG